MLTKETKAHSYVVCQTGSRLPTSWSWRFSEYRPSNGILLRHSRLYNVAIRQRQQTSEITAFHHYSQISPMCNRRKLRCVVPHPGANLKRRNGDVPSHSGDNYNANNRDPTTFRPRGSSKGVSINCRIVPRVILAPDKSLHSRGFLHGTPAFGISGE